jgi:hypothetical protein
MLHDGIRRNGPNRQAESNRLGSFPSGSDIVAATTWLGDFGYATLT